jgi:nicotinic acid phosphoribosyltransferase
LQYFLQKYLGEEFGAFFAQPVDEACSNYKRRVDAYLGPNNVGTDHIRALHELQYLPLEFRALPEGTLCPLRVPMLTVENTHDDFAWLVNYIETLMSSVLWLPCTSATNALELRKVLLDAARKTGSDLGFVDWQGHDFSFRGMPGPEAAGLSGMGHLLAFTGSDTLPALDLIEHYYGVPEGYLLAGSVPACYDDKTEVLTARGFVLFSQLNDADTVGQYHEDGSITFVTPTARFADRYVGPMRKFGSGKLRYVDAIVTPNHRMVVKRDDEIQLQEAGEIGRLPKNSRFAVAGLAVGDASMTKLSDLDRLEIAFQADGSYASRAHRYTGSRSGDAQPIRFTLKKLRKIERLREILVRLGYEYTETPQKSDYVHFWIKCPETLHKTFDWIDFSKISADWAREFIEEASHWDGSRHLNSMQYFSSLEENTDAVQTVAILAGYKTHRSTYEDERSSRKLQHIVSCQYGKDWVSGEPVSVESVDYDGIVYCVSVPTKMLVTRRDGRVLICGNTEHSVMCAGGQDTELETFERLLQLYPSGIVSVVSDTWDLWHVLTDILPQLKSKILARDGKLVIRPDSGNPADIVCGDRNAEIGSPAYFGVVDLLFKIFGGTLTSTGHKLLDSHIGCIYGDSINKDRMVEICERLEAKGYASGNIVFGVGSYTYQYVTRDTYGFAMKATWCKVNGEARNLFKAPKTGNGMKNSAKGRLSVMPSDVYGLELVNCASDIQERISLLRPVWRDGSFLHRETFDVIRARVQGSINK